MQNLPACLTRAEKLELAALLEEKKRRKEGNQLQAYRAYAKQAEFHAKSVAIRGERGSYNQAADGRKLHPECSYPG